MAPALRAGGVDLNAVLKGAAKGNIAGSTQAGKLPAGKILVVGQVALSFLLLITAGLLVRSFQKLTRLNPGYDREHLLLVSIYPEPTDYKAPRSPNSTISCLSAASFWLVADLFKRCQNH